MPDFAGKQPCKMNFLFVHKGIRNIFEQKLFRFDEFV